uniref:Uncharacterized protein n=1 Tax=Rhizophora mucronata TaxID=61149 RepID=A0A2P2MYQ6_RHIMU
MQPQRLKFKLKWEQSLGIDYKSKENGKHT